MNVVQHLFLGGSLLPFIYLEDSEAAGVPGAMRPLSTALPAVP
jgi:hypothetical protein